MADISPIPDRLGIQPALREVVRQAGKPVPGGSRRIAGYAAEGRFPAEQDNGRWYVRRADLPAMAAALGLAQQHAA